MTPDIVNWLWTTFFAIGALGGWVCLAMWIGANVLGRGSSIGLTVNGRPLQDAFVETSGTIIVTARFGGTPEVSDASLDAGLAVARERMWSFPPASFKDPNAPEGSPIVASDFVKVPEKADE